MDKGGEFCPPGADMHACVCANVCTYVCACMWVEHWFGERTGEEKQDNWACENERLFPMAVRAVK